MRALDPPHVSWYQLTLEPNTVFHASPPAGLPDDDLAWDIQQGGQEALAAAGYEQYEISAFARRGHRCRHNLNYWQFGDYLAAGAGAHGKLTAAAGAIVRYRKPSNPLQYMEMFEGEAPASPATAVAAGDLAFEFMLNVLRLTDGFSAALFQDRTGVAIDAVRTGIGQAIREGLLEEPSPGTWRPTERGFRFLNDLQARFLPG